MHLPWIATIDALIEALRKERDFKAAPDGGRSIEPIDPDDVQERLKRAISDLERLRSDIRHIASLLPYDPIKQRTLGRTDALDHLEDRMIRYPEQEGREGLAHFVERGGLFGPKFGAHIAAVIRGTKKLKAGTQSSFREGRERRYAVKQIMTIVHLYDTSTAAAIRAFAAVAFPDDPEARADERLRKWVERLQGEAQQKLSSSVFPVEEASHWQAFFGGIRPDLPRGYLRGRTYPDGMDALPPKPG